MIQARLDLMVTDEFYTTVNGAPGSKQPSYAKLDARLAIGRADGRWEVALVGRNLTDELYAVWYEPLVAAGPNTGYFATTARTRPCAPNGGTSPARRLPASANSASR